METFYRRNSAPGATRQALVRNACMAVQPTPVTNPAGNFAALFLLLIIAVLVSGCGGGARPQPQTEPVIVDQPREEGAITSGLDPQGEILSQQIDGESPWDLVALADQATGDNAAALRLAAIDGFLNLQDYGNAATQAELLADSYLDPQQQLQYELQRGRIAAGVGEYDVAINILQRIRDNPGFSDHQRAQAYDSLAQAQVGLQRDIDAVISLLKRDQLVDPEEQAANQYRIMSLVQNLDSLQRSILAQVAERNDLPPNLVPGWVEFSEIAQLPETGQQPALFSWRNRYPAHPALDQLLGGDSNLALESYTHIALLLPLTSPYGSAAKAFYDGFTEAYNRDTDTYKPTVSLIDIGDDPGLAGFYYRSAMIEGADFVVGPLGKDAVNAMLDIEPPALPTLVIGDVEPNYVSPQLYGISLSPEQEAQQVAERAYADGHRQAMVFRSATDWGTRAAQSFSDAWLKLGGTVVANNTFPDHIEDYSKIIQRLFEINQSEAREKSLSDQLGINLEFTPRRRNDMDMMFLAGNASQARLLVPQIRFFKANDLPVYATSNIFSGSVEPSLDADIDRVIFGDMRWMFDIRNSEIASQPEASVSPQDTAPESSPGLQGEQEPPAADNLPQRPPAHSPYSATPLDRLYALGLESYHLVPRLAALRGAGWQQYRGRAFNAGVGPNGNVLRQLDWATFKDGYIKRLESLPALNPAVRSNPAVNHNNIVE